MPGTPTKIDLSFEKNEDGTNNFGQLKSMTISYDDGMMATYKDDTPTDIGDIDMGITVIKHADGTQTQTQTMEDNMYDALGRYVAHLDVEVSVDGMEALDKVKLVEKMYEVRIENADEFGKGFLGAQLKDFQDALKPQDSSSSVVPLGLKPDGP